jgi:outer membrane protein assembly factor BamE (lipoprotein component of BamABCDE complex)
MITAAALILALLLAGCASQAPYYKPRKQHGCDCPKWNALPPLNKGEERVQVVPVPAVNAKGKRSV